MNHTLTKFFLMIAPLVILSSAAHAQVNRNKVFRNDMELADHGIDKLKLTFTELRPKGGGDPTTASKLANPKLKKWMSTIKRQIGHGYPYAETEIMKVSDGDPGEALAAYEKLPPWRKVVPFTTPHLDQEISYLKSDRSGRETRHYGGSPGEVMRQKQKDQEDPSIIMWDVPVTRRKSSFGAVQLRKETGALADYGNEEIDWEKLSTVRSEGDYTETEKALKSVKGARFGYKADGLTSGSGAWNTEGAVLIPYHVAYGSRGSSTNIHVSPAASWKLEEQENNGQEDINELKVSVPISVGHTGDDWAIVGNLEPYYQTDFKFDGGIYGATVAVEPLKYGLLGYYNETDFGGEPIKIAGRNLNHRFRFRALGDYSEVASTSDFMKRAKSDDWFRVGARISFDLALFDYNEKLDPITFGASYQFFQDVSGGGSAYSDLWNLSLNYWFSEYVGLTAEYQKGETPVADKDIDLFTIGFQIRY